MNHCIRHTLANPTLETLAQRGEALHFNDSVCVHELRCLREAYRERDVLRAWSASALLRAAVKERLERRAATCVHRAGSLGCADLVAGKRERVKGNRRDV